LPPALVEVPLVGDGLVTAVTDPVLEEVLLEAGAELVVEEEGGTEVLGFAAI